MPLPYQLGNHGTEIQFWQAWFQRYASSYAPAEDGYYGDDEVTAVKEMQSRVGQDQTGVFDQTLADRVSYVAPPADIRPLVFSVEGHSSDMFSGPVADTATELENEGICWHQPIGYNNGSIPFDNQSGVSELARLIGGDTLDNGRRFQQGTPWALEGYSQGGIVVFDFFVDYLAPGKPLNWRLPDLKAVLTYGNPCRENDSIAPWATSWITTQGTHGLDPYRRFGINGFPEKPDYWVDAYREGDIFSQNGDDKTSEVKAAVYEAIARGDLTSNPYSILAQIADLFSVELEEVIGIFWAIVSGITFISTDPNPHYSPYDITGGIDWLRDKLRS